MSVKGKVILVLLCIAVVVTIFAPLPFEGLENQSVFVRKFVAFLIWSSTLLFWVGLSAGWCFARDNGFQYIGMLVLAVIGMYLSLPIAIFALLKSILDWKLGN